MVEIAKNTIGVFTVIAGAIWGVVEYESKQAEARVKETLALVDRFHKPPFSDAFTRVNVVWSANEAKLAEVATDEKKLNQFTLGVIADNKLDDALLTTFDFYREVKVCIDRKICEADVAKAFFMSDARAIYNTNYPYITAKRSLRKDPSLASDLQAFVGAPR